MLQTVCSNNAVVVYTSCCSEVIEVHGKQIHCGLHIIEVSVLQGERKIFRRFT
jgi:hypothetical protein